MIDSEIMALKDTKSRLVQKNLSGVIEDDDYREQVSIINDKLAGRELERSECREGEAKSDLSSSLLESLLTHTASIWQNIELEDKIRFQDLIFPKGFTFANGIVGTTEIGLPFSLIPTSADQQSHLVSREGVSTTCYCRVRLLCKSFFV